MAKLQADMDGLRAQNQALNAQWTQASLERRTLTDRHDAEMAGSESKLSELRARFTRRMLTGRA